MPITNLVIRYSVVAYIILLTLLPISRVLAKGENPVAVDQCRIFVGPHLVHFTAYQPQLTGSTEFCGEIPDLGSTVFVFDYEGKALRNMTVEVEFTKEPEGTRIAYLPPTTHSSGTFNTTYKFTEASKYIAHVVLVNEGQKVEANIPFTVGLAKDKNSLWINIFLISVLFLALYFVYRLLKLTLQRIFRILSTSVKVFRSEPVSAKSNQKVQHSVPTTSVSLSQISDRPLQPGDPDALNFGPVARGLAQLLLNPNTQPPLTLAITAEWGRGKSSIMHLLREELRRSGFRPVWFNAWHHREEQNVLASLLEQVRKQAWPSIWSIAGFWCRVRLILKRHWLLRLCLSVLLMIAVYLGKECIGNPEKIGQIADFFKYKIGWEQTVVISERSWFSLCVPTKDKRELKDIPTFNENECGILREKLIWNAQKGSAYHCDLDNQCRFSSIDNLLKTVEHELQGRQISDEQAQQLLRFSEHTPPDNPFPISDRLRTILFGIAALVLLPLIKGMAIFGLGAGEIFKPILERLGIVQRGEPIGFRRLYETRFRQLVEVLGKNRLVIFIDDLDRCECDHAIRVLETTNFLVSSGECFFVLGMAPKYVIACVGLHFQKIAEEVISERHIASDGKPADAEEESRQERETFARQYLKKLVNIEAPVPYPNSEQTHALLMGQQKISSVMERWDNYFDQFWTWGSRFLQAGIILAMLFWAYQFDYVEPQLPNEISTAITKTPQTFPTEQAVSPTEIQTPKPNKPYGENSPNNTFRYVFVTITYLTFAGGITLLVRRTTKENIYNIISIFLKRIRVQLGGVQQSEDSDGFKKALNIWHDLIVKKDNAPRSIKAFINRVRYYAARSAGERPDLGNIAPSLVALAAIHYSYPHWMQESYPFEKLNLRTIETPDWINYQAHHGLDPTISENDVAVSLKKAYEEHQKIFNWPPSQAEFDYFKWLSEGMQIHSV